MSPLRTRWSFFALCLIGAGLFGQGLWPERRPPDLHAAERAVADHQSLGPVVAGLDTRFQEGWRAAGLAPLPPAETLQVARRLSLALCGVVPSLEEIRWLERLPSEAQLPWWVERLLADRRSADYLAERFARAYVGVDDGPFLLYRRRRFAHWLSDQLATNRPYDAVVGEMIASDGLWTSQPATNFLTSAALPDNQDKRRRFDEARLVTRVSRAFLGVRLDCCQCHDYPFPQEKPWTQNDFRRLAAFFGPTEIGLRGLREGNQPYRAEELDGSLSEIVEPGVPFRGDLLPKSGALRERLAAWVTHPDHGMLARATANRVWTLLCGRPLVEPLDDLPLPEPATGDAATGDTAQDTARAALELLADDFAAHGFDLRRLIRTIAATQVFRQASRGSAEHPATAEHERHWAAFPLRRLRPEQVVGGLLQAASVDTIDYESHLLWRLARGQQQNEFIKQYGDAGLDELEDQPGTIPQRLLMLNGNLIKERTRDQLLVNAATQIAVLCPDDAAATEAAWLAVLSRRPTPEELDLVVPGLAGLRRGGRIARLEGLFWTLLNTTEFAWNH